MKKTVFAFLLILFAAVIISVPVFAEEDFTVEEIEPLYSGSPLGDVNRDGYVDSEDLTVLARHVAKIEELDYWYLSYGDVNEDGYVDSADLTMLAMYVAKIIPGLGWKNDPVQTHNFEIIYYDEPTCQDGLIIWFCYDCGDSRYEYIPAVYEHDYQCSYINPPTCTEYGYETDTCIYCGDYYNFYLEPTGHKYVCSQVILPTETERGYEILSCSGCGETHKGNYSYTTAENAIETDLCTFDYPYMYNYNAPEAGWFYVVANDFRFWHLYSSEESVAWADNVIQSLGIDSTTKKKDAALLIHDFLCEYLTYDYTFSRYSVEEAINDRTCVCQGYAETYALLLTRCGIECYLMASSQINHAWNMIVFSDGSVRYVDVTWDDFSDSMGILHCYFLQDADHFLYGVSQTGVSMNGYYHKCEDHNATDYYYSLY